MSRVSFVSAAWNRYYSNINVLIPNFIVITVTHNWHGLSGGSKTGGNIRGSCLLLAFQDYNPAAAAGLEPGCMYQLIWCRGHEYQYIFISTKVASICLQDHKMHWTRFSFLRIAMRAWDSLHSNSNPSLVLTLADYHQPHFYPILWFAECMRHFNVELIDEDTSPVSGIQSQGLGYGMVTTRGE